jgi:CRP-like cAMP-binding protein
VQTSLSKLLLFERLDKASQTMVVEHTWTRKVSAGEILIQEGETGLAASELYVVKDGAFEVRPEARRNLGMVWLKTFGPGCRGCKLGPSCSQEWRWVASKHF